MSNPYFTENRKKTKVVLSPLVLTGYDDFGAAASVNPFIATTYEKNPTKCIRALASYYLIGFLRQV